MSDFSTKAIPGQLTVDEAEGIVECFVAGVGNKDSVGDIVLPGAFDGSLKRRKPRVVWGHDWNHPIGRVLQIYEVGPDDPRLPAKMKAARIGGLFAKVQFNLRSERGREAFANVLFFGPDQEWSIGYKTIQAVYDNTRQANLLKEVELYEVSPVLHGANQLTATISIKSDKQDDERVTSFKKSKWPMFDRQFAEMVKNEHPDIWDKGGNIKGDDQYTILTRIAEQGGVAKTEDQIRALELREAWIARHLKDFRLPGVIAQIKWLAVGSRGEGHMKDVVREAIAADREEKGYGWDHDGDRDDRREELMGMWRRLRGYAADEEHSSDDDPREELDRIAGNPDEAPTNSAMGRRAVLARALANELRAPVKIRTMTANTVIFDVMDEADPDNVSTMRSSWHAERGEVMIGKPERVRAETVYVPMEGGGGQAYSGDAEKSLGATIGGGRSREGQSEIDRDGDGVIFDGTPDERPAPKKRPQQESRPAANRATSNSKASYHRARWKNGEKSFFHEDGSGIIQDSNGKEYSVGNWEEAPSKVYANVPKNLRSKAKQAREAALRKADTERWNRELGGAGYEDILTRAQRKASLGRDANVPRSWKFNDSDGHTTTVEEDGSGVVRHRDGGVVFSYGGFDDPEALAETPAEMRKRLQKMRAYQWASNQVARASLEKSADSDMDVKADPRAGIPQEAITGDILRGYGPRRGNLERLLRYWRPIMKKPGGFRRCLVILADHPELYPLQNICAWLHHETTGLWPNEGCHHPGMKNCRRKLRGVRNGSLWSDREFSARLRRMGDDKKGMDWQESDDGYGDVTDDDVKYANRVLNEFLMEEKEFASYLSEEKNWMHVGDDQNEMEIEHDWVKPDGYADKPGGCGCGCSGKDSSSPYKSADGGVDGLGEKVGRALNVRNAERIAEAVRLLTQVLGNQAPTMQSKGAAVIVSAPTESLFDLRETLDPVIDYYGLDAVVAEDGVHINGVESEAAAKALDRAIDSFVDIQIKEMFDAVETKGIGRGLRRLLPGAGGGRGGRGGRRGRGGRGERFDPNAYDGNSDGMVQDNTPFERPATPRAGRAAGAVDGGGKNKPDNKWLETQKALRSLGLSDQMVLGRATETDVDTIGFAVREIQASMSDDSGSGRRVEVTDGQVADQLLDDLQAAGAKFDDEQLKKIRSAIEDVASRSTRGKPLSQQEMKEQRKQTARRVAFRELGLDGTVLSDKGPSEKEWDALERLVEEIEADGPANPDGSRRELEAYDIYDSIYDQIGRENMTDKEMANLQKIADAIIRDREMD